MIRVAVAIIVLMVAVAVWGQVAGPTGYCAPWLCRSANSEDVSP